LCRHYLSQNGCDRSDDFVVLIVGCVKENPLFQAVSEEGLAVEKAVDIIYIFICLSGAAAFSLLIDHP
jgi:hypothetical protein